MDIVRQVQNTGFEFLGKKEGELTVGGVNNILPLPTLLPSYE